MSRAGWHLAAWGGAFAVLLLSLGPVPAPPPAAPALSDKLVHALLYGGLALGFRRAYPDVSFAVLAGGLAVYGGVVEWLQGFFPPRTPSAADFIANCTGISIMLAVDRCRRPRAGPVTPERPP
ncbi:MAG: VanZ family protein [Gammaproteobacteria bacterium]